MEVATGWSTFANGGYKIQPYLIDRIESRDGQPLFIANPASVPQNSIQSTDSQDLPSTLNADANAMTTEPAAAERIIDERTAFILTNMLQDVIKRGTGRRALAMGRTDLAGKTGTTNESKDSWFSGYNADYTTTVWSGFDQPESLGRMEFGGTVALPIWMNYMSVALKDKPAHLLPEPAGILTLRVDPITGRAASPGNANAYFELFKSEDSPPSMGELDPSQSTLGSPLPADEAAPIDLF